MLTQHKAASPRLRNYHLPSSQAYGQGVQVRPSPQRRPTLTSVRSASGSEADQQERVLAPNQVKQYHVQQFSESLSLSLPFEHLTGPQLTFWGQPHLCDHRAMAA